MNGPEHPQTRAWTVGLRVWVERAGQAVLGKGRLELLEGIGRHHSISEAARRIGMSYRRAWLLVQSVNEAAGEPLVVAATGGTHGGGAQLTEQGRWAVALFRELQGQLQQTANALLPGLVQGLGAGGLHVAAAVSLEEVLGQLLADYARVQPEVRVRTIFGASDELADHVLAGGHADLFLTADKRQLDRLESAGLLRPGKHPALAANGLAAISLTGRAVLVRKPADLVRVEVLRIALAEPDCPLGHYTQTYLESLSLYAALAPRVVRVDNSRAVVATVRAGQADVGLVYSSDAAHAQRCRSLFTVLRPPVPIRYKAALVCRGQTCAPAQDLLKFLFSPSATRRFRRCGFLPVRGPG